MKQRIPAILFLFALSTLLPATTLVPMYLDDLTAASQTVVYGTVTAARTEWDSGHTVIYTIYTVQSSEYFKGNLGPSFELRLPGGERDGLVLSVAGVPRFQPGQEAVLFVWTGPDGNHQVTGFEQGAVTVNRDPSGGRVATRGIALGSAQAQQISVSATPPAKLTSRSLPELFDQIRASVARSRPRAQ